MTIIDNQTIIGNSTQPSRACRCDSMRQPRRLQLPRLLRRSAHARRRASTDTGATDRAAAGSAAFDAGTVQSSATGRLPPNAGRIAADIGTAALELAKQANGAGLERGALQQVAERGQPGAEAASYDCPADAAQR